MYGEINEEISRVKERLRKREKIEGLLKSAETNLKEETRRKEELKDTLNNEEKDVKDLENLSIKGIFLSLLGSKEGKLDKERTEFLAAKLKYEESCNSVNFIQSEIDGYYRQLRELGNAKYEYEELMRKKEELVMQAKDDNTRKILDLTEEIADIKADMREIKEAIDAGNSVLGSLERAAASLDSAESWGTWDMLGGGLITDMAKHSHIDEAAQYIQEANSKLGRFKRELADVNLSMEANINISSFDKFADYFFDGIFADWNVQSKVKDSLHGVNTQINRVKTVLSSLKSKYSSKEASLRGLEREIKYVIENA